MYRLRDLLLAAILLVLLAPILLVIAMAVRVTSPGPAIFAQTRIGRNRSTFTCYKFRTMRPGTGLCGTHQVEVESITRFGFFLRRSKLDELPQLWNVVRGDMSLVGPRPCLPSQIEVIAARERYGSGAVMPGITGLSQVLGVDMSDPEKLAAKDAEWLQKRTYFTILLRTLTASVPHGRAAFRPEPLP